MNKEIEIPEGYEARIEGNKIILELKESEDERIRKDIVALIKFTLEDGSVVSPGSHTTKEEMVNAYYTNGEGERNYKEAQKRIKEAMESGEKYVYLPGKNGSSSEFIWSATSETIARLRKDGFDIDVVWDPWEYWSVEWGY